MKDSDNSPSLDIKKENDAPKAPEMPKTPTPKVAAFENCTPANWVITPTKVDGEITAVNLISKETFEGKIKDFSKRLRG